MEPLVPASVSIPGPGLVRVVGAVRRPTSQTADADGGRVARRSAEVVREVRP